MECYPDLIVTPDIKLLSQFRDIVRSLILKIFVSSLNVTTFLFYLVFIDISILYNHKTVSVLQL